MVPIGMLALMAIGRTTATFAGVVNGDAGGFYVDLLNLQWWQAIIALIVALGISPAPWITALAAGRLLFRADLERQLAKSDTEHEKALAQQKDFYDALLADRKERYDDLVAANNANAQAAARGQERADELTDTLLEFGGLVEANNHFLASLGKAQLIAEGTASA